MFRLIISISALLIGSLNLFAISSEKNALKNIELLNKIQALPMAKAHKFIPVDIKDGGSLILATGYFNTPRGKRQTSLFLSKDLQTGIYGRGFDTKTAQEYKSFEIDELKESAGIVYGTGKDEYFLVIDPLCSACMNFDKTLPKYEKEIKLYIIFMSINPNHDNAINYILSKKTDKEKFKTLLSISKIKKQYEKIKISSKEVQQSVAKQKELSQKLGTTHTPTLYTKEASEVSRAVLEYRHLQIEKEQKKK